MRSSLLLAVGIAFIAVVWMLSGLLNGPGSEAEEATAAATANASPEGELQKVRVRTVSARPFINEVVVTGRSQASRAVEIRAETSGQVEEIFADEGASVAPSDPLARLEIRDREARMREAKELVAQRQIEFNAAEQLETQGFNSRVRLAEASAALEAARARLREAEVDLAKTKIVAPFEGVLNDRFVELGDYVSSGDRLFSIVDLDPLEFQGFVTERSVGAIQTGQSAKVAFLDGSTVDGTVTFVAPAANPDTRTFRVVVSVDNPEGLLWDGLTAELRLPLAGRTAHRISPSVLSLNDEGVVGVKLVGENDEVKFVPVVILADRPEAMYVDGLPEQARLITVGQEFVIDGQRVNPVSGQGDGPL